MRRANTKFGHRIIVLCILALTLGIGVAVGTVSQMFSQGNINITGNDLDVAINGSGFFQLQMPDGSAAYSRAGEFKLDRMGNIVTNAGANVMGYPTDNAGNQEQPPLGANPPVASWGRASA